MKTKWTPGPWRAKNIKLNHWSIEADSPHVEGKWQTVCDINGPWSAKNYEANAKLIAAAPEMYAILKACVTQHSSDIEERGNATRRLDFISRMAKYATDLADGKQTQSPI